MDYPYRRSTKSKQQLRQAAWRDFKAKALFVGIIGGGTAALVAVFAAVINWGTTSLSSPGVARAAVLDAGYTQPVHTGVAKWDECRTGSRREGRYYSDQFQAVAPNGRTVNLVVCRVEGTRLSTVMVQSSSRYRS